MGQPSKTNGKKTETRERQNAHPKVLFGPKIGLRLLSSRIIKYDIKVA